MGSYPGLTAAVLLAASLALGGCTDATSPDSVNAEQLAANLDEFTEGIFAPAVLVFGGA
jgi:hypothetical protein